MKLLILCVDGFGPGYARDNGFDKFLHSESLEIPRECFIETPDGPQPTTGRVWPSILSGRVQAHSLIERRGLRKWGHDVLMRRGLTWTRDRPGYQVNPWNEGLETVFNERLVYTWNLPTISPEWIAKFPQVKNIMEYAGREYQTFRYIAEGAQPSLGYDLGAIYTRVVDCWGHFKKAEDMKVIYLDISSLAWRLAQRQMARGDHLILVSDHGCLDGMHTDRAYIGATFPFEAENITDVRGVIEGALK